MINKSPALFKLQSEASALLPDHSPPVQQLVRPDIWHRWAVEFSTQNELAKAVQFFRHAIVLNPSDALLRFDFGVALSKAQRYIDAIAAFSEASRLQPLWSEPVDIRGQLEIFLEQRGCLVDAGDLLLPMSLEESRRFGNLFSPQTDFDNDVWACIDLVTAIDRLYPAHTANSQLIALANQHLDNAALLIAVARRLIGLSGSARDRAGEWMTIDDGLAAKRFSLLAVRAMPQFESLVTAALVLQVLGQHAHSLVLIDRAVRERPNDTAAITTLAELLIEVGETQAGVQQLSRLIQSGVAGGRQRLMRAMTQATDTDLDDDVDDEIEQLRSLLTRDAAITPRSQAAESTHPQPSHDRWQMLYTLGWRYEQRRQVNHAFEVYACVSEEKKVHYLAKHPVPEDPILRATRTVEHYGREFFQSRQGWGLESQRPIFIVGLPRTGTSLVEQILARHPEIHAAGELHDVSILGRTIGRGANDGAKESFHNAPHPPAMSNLTRSQVRELASQHLTSLSRINRSATYVVDKMPTNFQLLGMIALLFPGARIIHCVRNVIDTCVSCYRNNLAWPFFDLDALANYATAYQTLMDHWKDCLPLRMLDVLYERVVDDLEGESRRMLSFLDLSWQPQCLTFYESPRAVRTPSRTQIRRPIYSSSVDAWKSCRAHLKPLLDRLPSTLVDSQPIPIHHPLLVHSP